MDKTRAQPFPGDPDVTEDLVSEHGLNREEADRIRSILGRNPSFTELGIFSALWSEHCSYKHSRPILKRFPVSGDRVIQGPGENAGVLRLAPGWAVAFKIESHNHPSAVEPYQGAATGVGGILRDVFTMGARPLAMLNSLRFGPLDVARNRYLLSESVRGIADYGNCVGIPTLGGEVDFAECYSGNPLINAMCVGVLKEEELIRAVATGVGNVLISVGSRTGRDGIHGASFASEELSAESEQKRPQVQVGDPFTEKLLLEASLELISSRSIVAIQDMGAAGLVSSSAEMAAKGEVGVEIDVAKVPTREPGMTPYEVLLSESQERMLVVAEPAQTDKVMAVAAKWELEAAVIGEVTGDGCYRVRHGDLVVAEIPGRDLIEGCPVYQPPAREDESVARLRYAAPPGGPIAVDQALTTLLANPANASKRWVFEQYDSTVRANTVLGPGGDAGVLNVPGTDLGIAVTTDCNSRYVYLDPYEGGKAAVAEAARNIATAGALPIGLTNCLNFGSPEKPEVFYQFEQACRGIAAAAEALGTPVTGGNVSFYNESPDGAIYPTPVIGMVGVLDDVSKAVGSFFQEAGDVIILLGSTTGHLGASALWADVLDLIGGAPPPVDLECERQLIDLLVALAGRQVIRSAHDISAGGLLTALAECSMAHPYGSPAGARIDLTQQPPELDDIQVAFAEDHGRAVLSVPREHVTEVLDLAHGHSVEAREIGKVSRDSTLSVTFRGGSFEFDLDELRNIYFRAIPRMMEEMAAVSAGAA